MSETYPKIAAIQMASGPNVAANLLEVEKLTTEAVAAGARLVVLPENFAFLSKDERELLQIRERDGDGPLQEFLSQLARRHAVWLVGGTIPLTAQDPDRARAACLILDDQGRRVGRYDKIHLFDVHVPETDENYRESGSIEPGSEVVVVDSPFGRLGVAICYDLRFPELFRNMADQGVELIAIPAAFTAVTGKAHWEPLLRTRAIENLSYVIAAAQGGFHVGGRQTHGQSMLVDPWGTILDQLPKGSGFVIGELHLDHLAHTRRTFPVLSHRRIHCS
jgi:predicted amidohydrolase